MITRPIKTISGNPINQFCVMDVDPHGRFIAIYLQQVNSIHIIKTLRFTHSQINFDIKFIKQVQYEEYESVNSDAEIASKDLYDKYEVQKILICPIFNFKQLILVSNNFNIKIFSIRFQQEEPCPIYLKSQGQIQFSKAQPVQTFNYLDGQIYVSFQNGRMQTYHKVHLVWEIKLNHQKIKRESVRLLTYKQSSYKPYELKKNSNQKQQNKFPVGRPSRCKKLPSYHLAKFFQSTRKIKIIRPGYNHSKPLQNPSIIYIRRDNTLCRAQNNLTYTDFQITELCTNNQRPSKFNSQSEEYKFQKFKSLVLTPYIVSPCKKFIICSESQGFSIISKRYQWRKILHDTMLPTINPFFQQFLISVLCLFEKNMSEDNAKKAHFLLLEKYDFLLVLFSKEDYIYQESKQEQQKSFIQLELIATRKHVEWETSQSDQESPGYSHKKTSIKVQRFKLAELKMTNEDPEAIRWISPTQIIYFARKDSESDRQLYHAVFKEEVFVQKIMNVFTYFLVDQLKNSREKHFNSII